MTIVSLLDELVNALLKAEGTFLDNPKDFNSLEKSVKASIICCRISRQGTVKC